jgi:hypothetical protein
LIARLFDGKITEVFEFSGFMFLIFMKFQVPGNFPELIICELFLKIQNLKITRRLHYKQFYYWEIFEHFLDTFVWSSVNYVDKERSTRRLHQKTN